MIPPPVTCVRILADGVMSASVAGSAKGNESEEEKEEEEEKTRLGELIDCRRI